MTQKYNFTDSLDEALASELSWCPPLGSQDGWPKENKNGSLRTFKKENGKRFITKTSLHPEDRTLPEYPHPALNNIQPVIDNAVVMPGTVKVQVIGEVKDDGYKTVEVNGVTLRIKK